MTLTKSTFILGETIEVSIVATQLAISLRLANTPMNCYATSDGAGSNKYYLIKDRLEHSVFSCILQEFKTELNIKYRSNVMIQY